MSKKLISVCVPAYNRDDSLQQLINSFLNQNYNNKELIITDDSSNRKVEKLIKKVNSKKIKYYRNKKKLGFSNNLYNSIIKASGDYLIILGDDDVFISASALQKYVDVFDNNSNIGYVYSNQVQFSNNLEIQYEINMFIKNKLYKKGLDSIKNIWLTSIFIGGLGLRNDKRFIKKNYPKLEILHPQVELVGHFLSSFKSYVIADNLIGFRSRENQIIFKALKDKRISKVGKHQNVELFEIFNKISKYYNYPNNSDFLAKQLIKNSLIFLPKEKMILGNKIFLKNYFEFCKVSSFANDSVLLKLIVLFSLILPSTIIKYLRALSFLIVKIKNKNKFILYKIDLMKIIN